MITLGDLKKVLASHADDEIVDIQTWQYGTNIELCVGNEVVLSTRFGSGVKLGE